MYDQYEIYDDLQNEKAIRRNRRDNANKKRSDKRRSKRLDAYTREQHTTDDWLDEVDAEADELKPFWEQPTYEQSMLEYITSHDLVKVSYVMRQQVFQFDIKGDIWLVIYNIDEGWEIDLLPF